MPITKKSFCSWDVPNNIKFTWTKKLKIFPGTPLTKCCHSCQLQLFIKQVAGDFFCCFIHKKLHLTNAITHRQQFHVNEMSKNIFSSDLQAKLNRYQLTTCWRRTVDRVNPPLSGGETSTCQHFRWVGVRSHFSGWYWGPGITARTCGQFGGVQLNFTKLLWNQPKTWDVESI